MDNVMITRCVIYSRVSTDAQERDGTSLDTQERACLELAEANRWTVVRCVRDAASGFTLDREGVEELRSILRRGEAEAVIAYAVDRLSRNQNHIGVLFDEVQQAGARLEFVTERFEDTPVGRFILAARAFIAEVEREKIVERTTRGKAERARSGRIPQATGRGIYGYRYDVESGTRIVDESQARVVRRIFDDFVGLVSCNRITNDLNAEGVPAFGGGFWYPLTVRRILLNETYTGRTIYRRTDVHKVRNVARGKWTRRVVERAAEDWIEIEGATPPIISGETFDRAQARFAAPERVQSRPTRSYSLAGHIRCIVCDAAMTGQALMQGRYEYYRCRRSYGGPKHDRCVSPYVPRALLEDAVRNALTEVLTDPRRVLEELREVMQLSADHDRGQEIEAELTDIQARQRRLLKLILGSDHVDAALEDERRQLIERERQLESERAALVVPAGPRWDLDAIARRLPTALDEIRAQIASDSENFELLLRSVDAKIRASRHEAEISGAIPLTFGDYRRAVLPHHWTNIGMTAPV
jgi:site-specific DNA recombinase